MPTFGGKNGGNASELSTWDSPANIPATVLPGAADRVIANRSFVVDQNYTWRSCQVSAPFDYRIVVNQGVTMTITDNAQIEGEITSEGTVVFNGRLFVGANMQLNGIGTYRLSACQATIDRPVQLGNVIIEAASLVTISENVTVDSLTNGIGCVTILRTGAAIRSTLPIENAGTIRVMCDHADDRVVITGGVNVNAVQVIQGGVNTSGNPVVNAPGGGGLGGGGGIAG